MTSYAFYTLEQQDQPPMMPQHSLMQPWRCYFGIPASREHTTEAAASRHVPLSFMLVEKLSYSDLIALPPVPLVSHLSSTP